ncbi:hypothetical protein L484_015126 [Morus notabilis]|uniref:CRIB domain-containing protein n=2 Tax=Morus notabilis TaxID=981085 RepID=W9S709_9ROSA|nr:hypothetical protein L484_015126 [Morus notabilis]
MEEEDDDDEESLSGESTKSSFRSLSLRKPNISTGINRLFKGFKNFSQFFVYKEELKMDMEIGGPTDVKHVTHIGWDGSATISDAVMGWENLISPELLSVPSDPWRPSFEFSMAAQVPDQTPLIKGSAS